MFDIGHRFLSISKTHILSTTNGSHTTTSFKTRNIVLINEYNVVVRIINDFFFKYFLL